jgi:hypothetical protein
MAFLWNRSQFYETDFMELVSSVYDLLRNSEYPVIFLCTWVLLSPVSLAKAVKVKTSNEQGCMERMWETWDIIHETDGPQTERPGFDSPYRRRHVPLSPCPECLWCLMLRSTGSRSRTQQTTGQWSRYLHASRSQQNRTTLLHEQWRIGERRQLRAYSVEKIATL